MGKKFCQASCMKNGRGSGGGEREGGLPASFPVERLNAGRQETNSWVALKGRITLLSQGDLCREDALEIAADIYDAGLNDGISLMLAVFKVDSAASGRPATQ